MKETMIEELKQQLFMHGPDAIENFLGYEIDPNEEKDVTDNRLDEIIDQMPDDLLYKYYKKMTGKDSEYCNDYYFTFGSDEVYPFQNGWIVITAEDEMQARMIFKALYPGETPDSLLRFAFVYDEESWKKTSMYKNGENLGYGCHRHISLNLSFD